MRFSTNLLLLPLAATSSFALPSPRQKSHFRRIFRTSALHEREVAEAEVWGSEAASDILTPETASGSAVASSSAGPAAEASASSSAYYESSASSYASSSASSWSNVTITATPTSSEAIPAVTASAYNETLSPWESTSSNESSTSNSTGLDTVPPEASFASDMLSSLLASTTVYDSFTYSEYAPVATPAPSTTSEYYEPTPTTAADSAAEEAVKAAQEYAMHQVLGPLLPTITLEVVMIPTQVCALRPSRTPLTALEGG